MSYSLYLIKRGPKPETHRAPYHPVIICTKESIARWELGATSDLGWLWEKCDPEGSGGWLLHVWNGLHLQYNHVGNMAPEYRLPDGMKPGVVHDRTQEPWTLLAGAVWWSNRKMPPWCAEAGVVYPADHFTQQSILDAVGYNPTGLDRKVPRPSFWPAPVHVTMAPITEG